MTNNLVTVKTRDYENLITSAFTSQDRFDLCKIAGKMLCEVNYAARLSELKKSDAYIDLSEFEKTNYDDIMWYHYIPPYKECVIKRGCLYTAIQLLSLDPAQKTVKMRLMTHYQMVDESRIIAHSWMPGRQYLVTIYEKDGKVRNTVEPKDYRVELKNLNTNDIKSRMMDAEGDKHKNDLTYGALLDEAIERMPDWYYGMIDSVIHHATNKVGQESLSIVVKDLLRMIAGLNRLYQDKKRQKSANRATDIKKVFVEGKDERHIYHVNGATISVTDGAERTKVSTPKEIHYKLSSWEVRGYSYERNGKTIVVPPGKAYRHFDDIGNKARSKIKKDIYVTTKEGK